MTQKNIQDQALDELFHTYGKPAVESPSIVQKTPEVLDFDDPYAIQRSITPNIPVTGTSSTLKQRNKKKDQPAPIVRDTPVISKPWNYYVPKLIGFIGIVLGLYALLMLGNFLRQQVNANNFNDEDELFSLSGERIQTACTKVEHFLSINDSQYWQKLFNSLIFHMDGEAGFGGLNSYSVGEKYCYLRMKTADSIVVEMFNPVIISFSEASKVYYERNLYCQKRFVDIPIRRAQLVNIKYQDRDGNILVTQMKEADAALASQLIANLQGKSICDGSDKGLDTLMLEQ